MVDANFTFQQGATAPLRPDETESPPSGTNNDGGKTLNKSQVENREQGTTMNGDSTHLELQTQQSPQDSHHLGIPSPLKNENASLPRIHTSEASLKTLSGTNSGTSAQQQKQLLPSPSSPSAPSRYEIPDQLSPIDPLSQHILKRTNTEKSISRLKSQPHHESEAGASDRRSLTREESATSRADNSVGQRTSKEKKKGVSFLSRIIGSKKRDSQSESNDDVSELGEHRATGMDAEIFAQPLGHIPRYPPPPKYIKVRSRYTKRKDFDRIFVAQELDGRPPGTSTHSTGSEAPPKGKAVWAAEFSKDGKYLAVAGQDKIVRVWAVIATAEDRQAHEIEEEAQNDQPPVRLSAPVFKTQPVQIYEGHTASIVDLSWSKNNFLLTTSMDKTVRLWHITRNECLCCFKHGDFVTSIEFHPRDDRFFLAGSLDCKLRLWSIPDKAVAYRVTVPDMVTAVAFTPDGKHSIAGCLNGLCVIYDTDGLKAQSQIYVRSARGRNSKGSKITGIDAIVQPPGQENGIIKLLVTSNDSRIRLYNFRDRTLEAKFRGNENASSQIRATFSDDGRYVVCGSEDHRAHIWPISSSEKSSDKRPVEYFEAHSSTVTTAIMAPVTTKQILDSTGDLLYDLCNPPPVKLVSSPTSIASRQGDQGKNNEAEPTQGTPKTSNTVKTRQKAEESPAYVARSAHPGGNIIVTADCNGIVKVFRQDCGYHKRRHELWDTNVTFSRRLLGRTNSVSTRHSIASSLGKSSLHKTPSERILSWRNSVIGARDDNSIDTSRASQEPRTRSASPNIFFRKRSRTNNLMSSPQTTVPQSQPEPQSQTQPQQPQRYQHGGDTLQTLKEKPSMPSSPAPDTGQAGETIPRLDIQNEPNPDPLYLEGDRSYMFWDKTQFEAQVAAARRNRSPSLLGPTDAARGSSPASVLTSEVSSSPDDEEELSCSHCRGTNFRATRLKNGEQRLICVQCGNSAS